MGLGIPSVVGPVTEWLDTVAVEGCTKGAGVVVQTLNGVVVAEGTSVGGQDLVPVIRALADVKGERLVARQTIGVVSSPFTPDELAVSVGASPTSHEQLPPMAFRSRLFHCGAAVWLMGAAPGAAVTVTVGATLLGFGRASALGDARIVLGSNLPAAGALVSATQTAPSGFPALTGLPQVVVAGTAPLPLGPLPNPVILPPFPMGCEASVSIGGVVDGAEVTVTRQSDGSSDVGRFDLGALRFDLSIPFPPEGDRIDVTQRMPRCEVEPSQGTVADIRPAEAPPQLKATPPCAGSCYVHVEALRQGASLTVQVTDSGVSVEELVYVVPANRMTWDVPVKALPSGGMVKVTLEVCGFTTSSSVAIVDDPSPSVPIVAGPLYNCGRAVSVQSRTGAYIELWADFGNGPTQISARVRLSHDLQTIGVSPFLSVPESVWAHQLSCGGQIVDSTPPRKTEQHPQLEELALQEPLVAGQQWVLPTNVLSGAHVVARASSRRSGLVEEIGKRDITRVDPVVPLSRRLTTDDLVWAVQDLCGQQLAEGRQQQYSVIPGEMRFVLPTPLELDSGETVGGKFIVHSAEFACRMFDGSWILFADVENSDTAYDCGAVVGVSLNLYNPLQFGEMLDVDLAAANRGLPNGLALRGYPSRATWTRRGKHAALQNLAFWGQVLSATATWAPPFVAWTNHAALPDKPDWLKGDHAPPDPNQLFPPLFTDDV